MTNGIDPDADRCIGALLIMCVVLGSLGNLISLRYFLRKARDLPTCIYIITTTTDVVVCVMAISPGLSYLAGRRALLLGFPPVCILWGMYIAVFPPFTISMMALLSTTRTFILHFPLRRLSRFNSLLFITVYTICLFVIQVVIFVRGRHHFSYDPNHVFCYGVTDDTIYEITDNVFKTFELALPVPFIIISCICSSVEVMKSISNAKTSPRSQTIKRHATVTIILITGLYIIFNIPIFLLYLTWSIEKVTGGGGRSRLMGNAFVRYYAWGLTRVVSYTLNATLNPVVYLTRIRKYRIWVKTGSKTFTRRVSHLTAGSKAAPLAGGLIINNNTTTTPLTTAEPPGLQSSSSSSLPKQRPSRDATATTTRHPKRQSCETVLKVRTGWDEEVL